MLLFIIMHSIQEKVISPIHSIGNSNSHAYKVYTILLLCTSSSLLLSNYTIAKTSLYLYIISMVNSNILMFLVVVYFLFYPLMFILLISPNLQRSNIVKLVCVNKGILADSKLNRLASFLLILNLFVFLIFYLTPVLTTYEVESLLI